MHVKLTQSYVKNIKPIGKSFWITDSVVPGLRLYVGATGKLIWYFNYRPEGSRKKQSHKLGEAGDVITVSQARDMANDFKGRLTRGEEPQKKKVRVGMSLGEYIKDYYTPWVINSRRGGQNTIDMINSSFADLLTVPINELTVNHIEKWRQKRLAEGLKASSCNRIAFALKAALNWGVKREHFDMNPLQRLEKLQEHDSDIKVRYLSTEERTRLFEALDAREGRMKKERASHNQWLKERKKPLMPSLSSGFVDYLKPMVILSLNTGIRRGNLLSLVWGDIDLTGRIVLLRGAVSKTGKTLRLRINKTAVDTLTTWRKQAADKSSDALVFPSPKTGKRMDNFSNSWDKLLKDAQVDNFRWHDMRHDFASQLVMRGVDLNTVRELLGHSDMKMTLRYAHLAPESALRAVELLDDL